MYFTQFLPKDLNRYTSSSKITGLSSVIEEISQRHLFVQVQLFTIIRYRGELLIEILSGCCCFPIYASVSSSSAHYLHKVESGLPICFYPFAVYALVSNHSSKSSIWMTVEQPPQSASSAPPISRCKSSPFNYHIDCPPPAGHTV